jgi:hypothetical protein
MCIVDAGRLIFFSLVLILATWSSRENNHQLSPFFSLFHEGLHVRYHHDVDLLLDFLSLEPSGLVTFR